MNFNYKYCLLLLGSAGLFTSISTSAYGLDNHSLEFTADSALYLAQKANLNSKANSREYTFKSPDSKKIFNTEEVIKVQGYKVEVYGNEQKLLQQIKDIEPAAFIQGNTIQVGIFSEEVNAQSLVQKLAIKGFWARIKTQ